jgi:hypothetical protein
MAKGRNNWAKMRTENVKMEGERGEQVLKSEVSRGVRSTAEMTIRGGSSFS